MFQVIPVVVVVECLEPFSTSYMFCSWVFLYIFKNISFSIFVVQSKYKKTLTNLRFCFWSNRYWPKSLSNLILPPKSGEHVKPTGENQTAPTVSSFSSDKKRQRLDETPKSDDRHSQETFGDLNSKRSFTKPVQDSKVHRPKDCMDESKGDSAAVSNFYLNQKTTVQQPSPFYAKATNQFGNQLFLNTHHMGFGDGSKCSPSSSSSSSLTKLTHKTDLNNNQEKKLCNGNSLLWHLFFWYFYLIKIFIFLFIFVALNIENLVNNDSMNEPLLNRHQDNLPLDFAALIQHQLYQQIQSLQASSFYQFNNIQKQTHFNEQFYQWKSIYFIYLYL